jgi:hypothetical protein
MTQHLVMALTGLLLTSTAGAAPVIERWAGEADKRGGINFSVTCDNGKTSIIQCLRDDRHCGYDRDQPVAAVAEKMCERLSAPPVVESPDQGVPVE